jgi:RNA polymerase sigma-70 factor (ECF subfamily)
MSDERELAPVPEASLIAQAQAGQVEAFGELYHRYMAKIYRYIRSRVGTDRDAEDLTGVVFLNAFQALGSYKERGAPFGAYLYRIARNKIVDHYRNKSESEPWHEQEGLLPGTEDTEASVVQAEDIQEIRAAMLKLPENYVEIIRLRVLLELPTEEVGRWIGKNPSNVRVLLHRALKALRRELDHDDG